MRNPARPAVIVPTQAVDADELAVECAAAEATGVVDVIEWRVDPLLARSLGAEGAPGAGNSPAEAVLDLLPAAAGAGLPVLVTVRTAFEGGLVDIGESDYAEVMRGLIAGLTGGPVPLAVDVEIDRAEAPGLIASAREAGIAVIASHHSFESTDSYESLLATFRAMGEAGADVAKVAMMPQNPAEVARLLAATDEADSSLSVSVLGISMGPAGRASRIMGADFGSCATFAQVGRASAPGQIDAVRLAEILDRVCD